MTAPNTTTELVERIAAEYVAGKHSTLEEALQAALSKQAATIASLTAERDAWRLSAETLKSQIQMDRAEHEAVLKIVESLKIRIKELETEIKQLHEAEWDHQ